jgi:preprotein translocase subunit YajC
MPDLGTLTVSLILVIIAIALLWWILSKLYQRSTTELSFVRTGMLGQKVVISGGAIVVPVVHDVTRINMNTVRIKVKHENENALITHDRMRVNVEADFHIRVEPTKGGRCRRTDARRQDHVAGSAQGICSRPSSPTRCRRWRPKSMEGCTASGFCAAG